MDSTAQNNQAALEFTPLELLQAYISERLDRLVDHMISRGERRLAVYGSREHLTWLTEQIYGGRHLPITAFIERPDRAGEFADLDAPSGAIEGGLIPEHADAVLIADDRCERALHQLAVQHAPLGTTVFRLYHRFPIGLDALGETTAEAAAPAPAATALIEAKPDVVANHLV